jgi:hypothetical protein
MPLSRARGFHGNHEGSLTTYDHVNSDGSQSVRAMQSYSNNLPAHSQNRRKPTDDVGRMDPVRVNDSGATLCWSCFLFIMAE